MTESEELVKSNTQAQLIEIAKKLGINTKKSWTKIQIADLIVARQENEVITEKECKRSRRIKKSDVERLAKSRGIDPEGSTRSELCGELANIDEAITSKKSRKSSSPSRKYSKKDIKKLAEQYGLDTSGSSKEISQRIATVLGNTSQQPQINLQKYTKSQLQSELDKYNVYYTKAMSKSELIALLEPVVQPQISQSVPVISSAPIISAAPVVSSGPVVSAAPVIPTVKNPDISPCTSEQFATYSKNTEGELEEKLKDLDITGTNQPYDKNDKIRYLCSIEKAERCDPSENKYCDDGYVCNMIKDNDGVCIPKSLAESRKPELVSYSIDGKIVIGTQSAIDKLTNSVFKSNPSWTQNASKTKPVKPEEGAKIDEAVIEIEKEIPIIASDDNILEILKELKGVEGPEVAELIKTQKATLKCLGLING